MADKVKVAILGGGRIMGAHMQGFPKVADRCEIVAVAETNPARDEAIRPLVGTGPRIVRDYQDALALPEVQAVDILLPHHLHMPATIDAARAGKHVLVEEVEERLAAARDYLREMIRSLGSDDLPDHRHSSRALNMTVRL